MRMLLGRLRRDGGTQVRADLSSGVIDDYARLLSDSKFDFPPAVVFFDGQDHWLADGFHRHAAYLQAHRFDMPVEVRPGTLRDAILYAVGANSEHGLPRSLEDRRRAVKLLLDDPEWRRWSDSEIGARCKVDHKTVASLRSLGNSQVSETPAPDLPSDDNKRKFRSRSGKVSTMKTGNIGKKQTPRRGRRKGSKNKRPAAGQEPPSGWPQAPGIVEQLLSLWEKASEEERKTFLCKIGVAATAEG